jgi:Concanavalin A-like lectin/glucanases superfamily
VDDPEPIRRLPVRGTWAYVSALSVAPAFRVSVHVSAEAAHEIEFVRLGRKAVLDPAQSLDADRADAEVLATVSRRTAAAQTITPGSYVHIAGEPVPSGGLSMGTWLRLWKMPEVDVVQVAWQALIGDIDYPAAARFGLVLDQFGRIGLYAGDGGQFRHEWLHHSPPVMKSLVGRWVHVAGSWSPEDVRLYLDGRPVLTKRVGSPAAAAGPRARLRIGAMAEHGAADDFLEGDIAQPFVCRGLLDEPTAARLAAARGDGSPADAGLGELLGWWPLNEERGSSIADASGNGRSGTLVNHGTWMIGGPRFEPGNRKPLEYSPRDDPHRGHGLRLCSDDLVDAQWPAALSFDVPVDAASGVYAARLRLAGQSAADARVAPFVVSRRRPRRPGSVALLAATNTWRAYGLRPTKEHIVGGLGASFYSLHLNGRPFFHVGTRLPMPYAQPYAFESHRATATRSTHLVRTERLVEAWLEREGYPYEVLADIDLHEEPDFLDHFAALAIVGHSEYWTDEARAGVLRYLDRGGRVLSLSGDTLSVRVSFDPTGSVMEARKIVYDDDPRWLSPAMWGESWHAEDGNPGGSYRRLGKPAWDVLGMSFKGMIDDGTTASFAPYSVVAPDHFLFHTPHMVPIGPDGTIGTRSLNGSGGASGYEFDANPDRSGLGNGPLPGVTTLASVFGQLNVEGLGDHGHGADLIYWRRPAGGTVVNFGSIAAGGALAVDPAIAALVRNTLDHFGIRPDAGDR